MKKLSIMLIVFVFAMVLSSSVFAIDLNLINSITSNQNETTNTLNTTGNETLNLPTNDVTNITTNETTNTVDNNVTNTNNTQSETNSVVSSVQDLPESALGIGNIINILLITVGVILILLGIALLIKK